MTFRHWASVTLYTSACALAQSCVFDKQFPDPFLCGLSLARGGPPSCERTGLTCLVPSRPFSRAPEAIRHTHLCQFWYGPCFVSPAAFLVAPATGVGLEGLGIWQPRRSKEPAPRANPQGRRTIDLLSIDYAFRPRLRSRLTLGGFTFPRKPWVFGGRDSHPSDRYSSRHIHFLALHGRFRSRFAAARNALLPLLTESAASAPRLFPIIIGAGVLDQ